MEQRRKRKMSPKRRRKIILAVTELIILILIAAAFVGVLIWGVVSIFGSSDENESRAESKTESEYSQTVSQTESRDISDTSEEEQPQTRWELILVNRENPLPSNYKIKLAETDRGQIVDERIKEPLERMLADAHNDGILARVNSSYRTFEDQQTAFEEKIQEYINQGFSEAEATEKAKVEAAAPGTSEHQTGLAVDISTSDWEAQSAYEVWEWLAQNCVKYGFIIRYTEEKEHITGFVAEPWHLRYVGIEAAEEITRRGICLEEYLG